MMRSRAPTPWFLVALASGGGVLALGILGLWNVARTSQERARDEAVRTATIEARAVREALHAPESLEALPASARFAFDAGGLVAVEGITWTERPPETAWDASLPGLVLDRLERAEREEFVSGDPDAARATLAQTAELIAGDPRAASRVAMARAWLAERTSRPEERAALLAPLREGARPELIPVLEGMLLLSATTGEPWPLWTTDALRHLPHERAIALLAALETTGRIPDGAHAIVADTRNVRETLRTAAHHASFLRGTRQPTVLERQGRLLIYHPTDARTGRGAWIDPRAWLDALLARGLDVGPVFVGTDPPENAIPAGPALHVVPRPVVDDSPWARPPRLLALLGVLGAFLLASLLFSLRAMRHATEQMRLRAEFLTSITHELKTPLASVRLLSERLCSHELPSEKQREYHELVRGEIDRLSALIENLLDLGRLERGDRRVDPRPMPPALLTEEVVASHRPLAERDGLAIHLALTKTERLAALDPEGFRQVLLNVLENARKYAAAGRRLDVVGHVEGETYAIRVRDHGDGVPQTERERIFQRFERGARHRESAIPGVGVGLSTARLIVRALGGEITCEDPADGGPGAVFRIVLPLLPPGAEVRAPSRPLAARTTANTRRTDENDR